MLLIEVGAYKAHYGRGIKLILTHTWSHVICWGLYTAENYIFKQFHQYEARYVQI